MGRTPGKPTASARVPVRLFASLMESTLKSVLQGSTARSGPSSTHRSAAGSYLPGGAGNSHFRVSALLSH
jgi:hypothetical protein